MRIVKIFCCVTFLLFSSPVSANAATQAKPGTKCTKSGLTQSVSGVKFTCVKSGSKLVWNKGVRQILLPSIPRAEYNVDMYVSKAISDPTTNWIVGEPTIGYRCWREIAAGDLAVLQVKAGDWWINKQIGYPIKGYEKCPTGTPDISYFKWSVDEFGDSAIDSYSRGLTARVIILNSDGTLKDESVPFVKRTYNSLADQQKEIAVGQARAWEGLAQRMGIK